MYHRTREKWHAMAVSEVLRRLKTDKAQGLSPKVCRTRLERFGNNELFCPQPRSVKHCIQRILTDPALMVLAFVCLIALCFARFATALTVLLVLAVSCTVSIVAYVKTNRIKESMSERSSPRVRLVRGGQTCRYDASLVVPGDIILLTSGDVVPCDARLIAASSDFCVQELRLDENGKESYARTAKNADVVYEPTDHVPPMERENMIYAASVVQVGQARAVVTETGEATWIAARAGAHPLALQVGEPSYLAPMRRYMNRYSLIMCALILPVTLIGIFAGGGRIDILDVLLLTLSLVVSSMSEQVLSMGRIICACSVIRASMPGIPQNAAFIKNYRTVDELSRVDELFLYGKEAISDGRLHPYAVYADDELFIGPKIKTQAVLHFYEMVSLYENCATDQLYRSSFPERAAWSAGIEELGDTLGFDRASLKIRTVSLQPLPYSSAWVEVALRQNGGQSDRRFRIHRCDEPEPLLQCNARRVNDSIVPLDTQECKRLFDVYCQLKNQGTEVCAYIREEGGLAIFEGILSLREAYAPDIPDILRQLEESHVRVSLFLPEEGKYYLNYLLASGWIDSGKDAVSASRLRAAGRTLADVFDKKRVFFGFSQQEVAQQIQTCQSAGKTTASLGLCSECAPVMTPAEICFACERGAASEGGVRGECEAASMPQAQGEALRRRADVLVHRAGVAGGGLSGIVNAVMTARSIHVRMMIAMQYLLVAQLLRMTLVIFPLLFGRIMISPSLLLISGVWVDLAFVLVCAFHHCSSEMLRHIPDYREFFKKPLWSRPDWLFATVVSGAFTVLTGGILLGTGAMTEGKGLEMYVFLSLLAVQLCLVLCLLRTVGNFSGHWRSHLSSTLVLVCLTVLILPVVLIAPIATAFGGGGMSLLVLLLVPLAPLYLIGCYFLSVTYRQKIYRRIKKYTLPIRRRFVKLRRARAYTDGGEQRPHENRQNRARKRR